MINNAKVTLGEPGPNDVVFDCANCGRSLCIDRVAAGFSITCPHCATQQQVPGEMHPTEFDTVADAPPTDEGEELRQRATELQNMLEIQQGRLEQISREMALIQAAIDRIVGLLRDAQVEPTDTTSA